MLQAFSKFLDGYRTRTYQKGQTILHQGDTPSHAYVIKSGFTKMFEISALGENKALIFDQQFEIFPIGWVFHKIVAAQFYYEAFTECEVYLVPREDILHFFKSDPTSMFEIFDYFISRHLAFQERILALEQPKAADKILFTLKFLTDRFSIKAGKSNSAQINLPLTHQEMAGFIGLTRETTGIELKKLEKLGIISYKNQCYIVNLVKLNKLMDTK